MIWKQKSNDDLALNLELWLDLDGKVQTENQIAFFKELVWRLRLMNDIDRRVEDEPTC